MSEQHRDFSTRTEEPMDDEIIARLEALDDVIFPAIDGDRRALQRVEPAWQQTLDTLGPETVRESRQQYLRYALATWDFLKNQAFEHPQQLVAVMQIIMMLTGDDSG